MNIPTGFRFRFAAALPIIISGCGVAPAAANEGGQWVPMASMQLARQETGAARIGEEVYVVGGLISGPGLNATDTVEVYDIAGDSWSFIEPMPAARDHMAVAAVDGKLFVFGGYAADFAAKNQTFIYDPVMNSWSNGAPFTASSHRRNTCPRFPLYRLSPALRRSSSWVPSLSNVAIASFRILDSSFSILAVESSS